MVDRLKTFDTGGCDTYLIKEYDDDSASETKFMVCVIGGKAYRLNVTSVPENKLDLFARMYSCNLLKVQENTERNVRKEISDKFNDFLVSFGKK